MVHLKVRVGDYLGGGPRTPIFSKAHIHRRPDGSSNRLTLGSSFADIGRMLRASWRRWQHCRFAGESPSVSRADPIGCANSRPTWLRDPEPPRPLGRRRKRTSDDHRGCRVWSKARQPNIREPPESTGGKLPGHRATRRLQANTSKATLSGPRRDRRHSGGDPAMKLWASLGMDRGIQATLARVTPAVTLGRRFARGFAGNSVFVWQLRERHI